MSLSVPDNKSMKDTLQTFVTTITQQKKQIITLKGTMTQMSVDNSIAQQTLITWTTNCIKELKDQNNLLLGKLDESFMKMQNFSYNIQGFADKSEADKLKDTKNIIKNDFEGPSMNPPLVLIVKAAEGDSLIVYYSIYVNLLLLLFEVVIGD